MINELHARPNFNGVVLYFPVDIHGSTRVWLSLSGVGCNCTGFSLGL